MHLTPFLIALLIFIVYFSKKARSAPLLYYYLYCLVFYLPHPDFISRRENDSNDSNDGSTWESAKRTISAAFEDSGVCTRIWIAEGRYEECGFKLLQAMEVYGGFRGTENNLQERTSGTRTIISADASPAFDNSYSSTCPLTSALIQDICFEDSKQGVARNFFANVSILNCTLKNNLC